MNKQIEIIARAIIVHQNQILLCKGKNSQFYFLPGGHVEFGETIEKALRRELKEELNASVQKIAFLQPIENLITKNSRHEINFLFLVSLKSPKLKSLEDHIEFAWFNISELAHLDLRPQSIKNIILP